MHPCVFTECLFPLPLAAALRGAKDAGFDAVELACAEPHLGPRKLADAETIAREIRDAGLEVAALSLHNRFSDEGHRRGDVESAVRFIEVAPVFGARLVKMTPGYPTAREATGAHWDRLAGVLREITPVARAAGVRLVFETYLNMMTNTLESSLRFLDLADADVVGLTVDFSNLALAGDSMADVVDGLKDRMWHAHVKNGFPAGEGGYDWRPLGEGLVDYAEVIGLLRDVGYD